jgi:hypothetical protein
MTGVQIVVASVMTKEMAAAAAAAAPVMLVVALEGLLVPGGPGAPNNKNITEDLAELHQGAALANVATGCKPCWPCAQMHGNNSKH